MKRKQISRLLLAIVCSALSALVVNDAGGAEKVYQWKWYSPYDLNISPSMGQLPKIIEKHTNGRVKVTLYVAGEHPFQGPDMPRAVKSGAAQMADVLPGYCIGIDPRLGAVDLPFIADSAEEEESLVGTVLKKVTDKLYNDYGLVYLASYPFPYQSLSGNVLLKDLNSLKGKKVRVYNKVTADMISTLGGSPVTIPTSETYQALEKGVVDAALGSLYSHVHSKRAEVAKSVTVLHSYGQGSTYTVVVSKEALNELPPDLQAKVLAAGREYQTIAREMQHDLSVKAVSEAKEKFGNTVITLDSGLRQEIRKKMKEGCWDKWARTFPGGPELLAEIETFHTNWVKAAATRKK